MINLNMDNILEYYLITWIILCVTALLFFIKDAEQFPFVQKNYWRFLFQPWKVITFTLAIIPMVLLAPYSGDPTWDYIDAAFMSVLTFITAPWSIGIIYRFINHQANRLQLYGAVCLWLFSASWSYDAYIYWRDGFYPMTWSANLLLSSCLYIAAGLMWNISWNPSQKAHFAFRTNNWFNDIEHQQNFWKIMIWILPFVFLAIGMIMPFALSSF